MAYKIGFATEYYTLWDCFTEPVYFTDANGKHWHVRDKSVNNYVKNISTDLAKAQGLYPGVAVDEDLRGRTRSYWTTDEGQDLCPWIFKFGKHCGRDIKDVAELDLGYLVWAARNVSGQINKLINALPQVQAELAREARRVADLANSHPCIPCSGEVELTFLGNPNTPTLGVFDSEELGEGFRERFKGTAVAYGSIGEGHRVAVIFPQVREVAGLYPYAMAVIGGKAVRTKGKTLKLELELLRTERYQDHCFQVATLK